MLIDKLVEPANFFLLLSLAIVAQRQPDGQT